MLLPPKITKTGLLITMGMVLLICIIGYATNFTGNKSFIPQDTEVAKQNLSVKVSAATDLIQKIRYAKCDDQEIFKTKATEVLFGLNLEQLQNVYNGWNIDKFDEHELVMSLSVDGMCREHINNMFIGIKDGYVTVFYGKPENKPIIKEITPIAIETLPPQDLAELKRGMVLETKENLLRTLEGMQSR